MGQLAFLKMFILVAISFDVNNNRRHVHVFKKGMRHQHSLAKIWIEKNGEQCVELPSTTTGSSSTNRLRRFSTARRLFQLILRNKKIGGQIYVQDSRSNIRH